eukprot:scaffold4714_cov130-Skeletonema_dohrnii-CCMP3373.AAC.3
MMVGAVTLHSALRCNGNPSFGEVRAHVRVPVAPAAVSDGLIRSPMVRRYSDADTTNKCFSRVKDASILSWPTIMGYLKQLIVVFTA